MRLVLAMVTLLVLNGQSAVVAVPDKDTGSQHSRKSKDEIQVVVDYVSPENGTEPMQRLAQALERHPGANRFRVTWRFGSFLQGGGSALYDRQLRTLKYWYRTRTPEYSYTEHGLFHGVSKELLRRVAQEHEGKNTMTDGVLFDTLHRYGCRREAYRHTRQP